ncbi:MAG: site-2 protease family protein [Patescibacteria group bacterium]
MEIFLIIILIILIFYSIILHEIAHGYVAYLLGDPTAKYEGRITLNPTSHIDPIGTIIFPLFTYALGGFIFGWAKPVPYNPFNLKYKTRDPILIALAGPVTNLVLMSIFLILLKTNFFPLFNDIFFQLIRVNLVLALFNLLPIPPLDGSKLLLLKIPLESYVILESYGFIFVLLFIYLFSEPFFHIINKILNFLL